MADKIFPTDFNETEQSGITRGAQILISTENAIETTFAELGNTVDSITGIDAIGTGEIPIKASNGQLESSGITPSDIVTESGSGIAYEIANYTSATAIGNSGLFTRLLTSFGVLDSNGVYPMANISNGGNALVGKIALQNSTRGLALGLLNNGTTQEAALYPISGGTGSSTPQFLAKQSYVQEYITANAATQGVAISKTQTGEFLVGIYDNTAGVETITVDISLEETDTEVDGVIAATLWALEGSDPDVLITTRNTASNSDDENGLYRLTAYVANDIAVYTKIVSPRIIDAAGINGNTFIKTRRNATSSLGNIIRTYYTTA